MTTPAVKPSKSKAVIALIGSLLSAIIPLVLQVSTALPPPWPAIIGGVVALLTMFGVYQAPYKPPNTELIPVPPLAPPDAAPPAGGWTNPWRRLND